MTLAGKLNSLFGWRDDLAGRKIRRREFWLRFSAMYVVVMLVQMTWIMTFSIYSRKPVLADDSLPFIILVLLCLTFASLHFQPIIGGRFLDLGFSTKWPRRAHRIACVSLAISALAILLLAGENKLAEPVVIMAFLLAGIPHVVFTFGIFSGFFPSKEANPREVTS